MLAQTFGHLVQAVWLQTCIILTDSKVFEIWLYPNNQGVARFTSMLRQSYDLKDITLKKKNNNKNKQSTQLTAIRDWNPAYA